MGTEKVGHAYAVTYRFVWNVRDELEQTEHLAGLHIEINIVENGTGGQTGHGSHIAKDGIQEASTSGCADLTHANTEARRRAFLCCISGEGKMSLCHADRKFIKAEAGIACDLFFGFGGIIHAVGTINGSCDLLDLFLDGGCVQRIQELELAGLVSSFDDCLSQFLCAFAAICPMGGGYTS